MEVKMLNLIENFREVVMKREHPAFPRYNGFGAPEGFSKGKSEHLS